MKPISDLVRKYGSPRKTGTVLSRCHATVDRWAKAGALIDSVGDVWIKTAKTGVAIDLNDPCEPISGKEKNPKGIDFMPNHGTWRARITKDGKTKHLGSFKTFEEALQAREMAKTNYKETETCAD